MYCAKPLVIAAAVLLGLAGGLRADDAAVSEISGGTIAPTVQHPSVRMVSETVTARVTNDKAYVRCEFVFRNEGKATAVKMGFPEHAWGDGDGGAFIRLQGFKSWVDGRPVKVTYRPGKEGPSNKHADDYSAWYVKDVPFSAGQTRRVVDEYHSDLGCSGSAGAAYDGIGLFNYVLKTGKTWKGPIGRAVIKVDASMRTSYCDIVASPRGFTKQHGVYTWTLTEFEPKEDVHLEFTPRCPKLNGQTIVGYLWTPYSVDNGIVMAGSRFLEELGAEITPDKHGRTCTIKYGGRVLRLQSDSKTAMLNGKNIRMPRPFRYMKDGGICVIPVSAVVRALGGRTEYDRKALRLNIWLKQLTRVPPPTASW